VAKAETESLPLEAAFPVGLKDVVISSPPHELSGASLSSYQLTWGLALLPAVAGAFFLWRLESLALVVTGILAAAAAEGLCSWVRGLPLKIANGHAGLMGCLLALTLPAGAPPWLAAVGAGFGILFAQEALGGSGFYFLHPALAGRLFVYLSWPKYFHRPPLASGFPLSLPGTWHGVSLSFWNDFLFRPGHLTGEASAALLAVGAAFLLAQGMKWRISAGALILVGLGTWAGDGTSAWFHGNVLGVMCSPYLYLLIGFLALEPLTTPLTHEGQWVSGLSLGALFACLLGTGGDPEGLFALPLAVSLATPVLDRLGDRRR
jgi:electron transport complex protein RnfD